MTWQQSFDVPAPRGAAGSGLKRLLREVARAGVAWWEDNGRLACVAVDEPPASVIQLLRVAAGDLLALDRRMPDRNRPVAVEEGEQ